MPLFRSAITSVSLPNSEAVLVFSHLLILYSFASEVQDERLFLATNTSTTPSAHKSSTSVPRGIDGEIDLLPPWLYFLRNGCALLCDVWDHLESSPVAPLAEMWDIPILIPPFPTPLLTHLLSLSPSPISSGAWTSRENQIYEQAAKDLASAFASTASHPTSEYTTWDALRVWPMHLSVSFLELINEEHPGSLVLLAHYCILLKKIEGHWYFDGRSRRLMKAILGKLEPEWWACIRWPLEEIGVDMTLSGGSFESDADV
jgi:hypothetical protein